MAFSLTRTIDPEKALFWALLVLLAWVPIPLGSNRGWAWALLIALCFVLLIAWLVLWALGSVRIADPLKRAWPAFIVLGLWILLHALHVLPLPEIGRAHV